MTDTTVTDPPTSADEIRLDLPADAMAALADRRWAYQQYGTGVLREFHGQYVAVHDQRVVGHGPNREEVRERASRESGVPPARLVVVHVFRPTTEPGE